MTTRPRELWDVVEATSRWHGKYRQVMAKLS